MMRLVRSLGAVILAALAMRASAQAAGAAAAPAEARYEQAVAAYEAHDFAAAEAELRALVGDGVEHPDVLMALGNAAYRLGHFVEATYAYEWARRIAPADDDVRANLEMARARLVADVPATQASPQARWLRDRLERIPARASLLAFAIAWTLGWLVIAARQRGRLAGATWMGLALLLAAIPLLIHGAWQMQRRARIVDGLVQVTEMTVRSGPGEDYATLFALHAGAVVECRAERSGWRRIAFAGGTEGWVPSGDVAVIGDISTLRVP
jgi:tetratricopeptide (TPR) repeat protein